jgi:hypothetical protein
VRAARQELNDEYTPEEWRTKLNYEYTPEERRSLRLAALH